MDLNALLNVLLSDESIGAVSQKAGTTKKGTASVLSLALPLLLNGASQQANNTSTAESFANALVQHSASDTSNLSSFVSGVDPIDGGKIVAHLLGLNTVPQTQTVAQQAGVSESDTSSILATAAPLLMSLMGQQTQQQTQQQTTASVIPGLMGSLLGGNAGAGMGNSVLNLLTGAAAQQEAPQEAPQVIQQEEPKEERKGFLDFLLGLLK